MIPRTGAYPLPRKWGEDMYGHVVLDGAAAGRRCRVEREAVLGLPLLRAAVAAPPGLRERALFRRVRRAGERLWEQGVNRVLVGEDFPPALWGALRQAGLAPVETEALCREAAEPLVLALLERMGLDPARATVCLAGSCGLGAVQNAAEALARRVGRLVIDCPGRGSVLPLWLHQEFGLPLVEPGSVRPDVTAAFSPEKGQDAALRLCGPVPDLGGLRLVPAEGSLPEGFDPLPLMAALREGGCLRREEVRVAEDEGRDTSVCACVGEDIIRPQVTGTGG